MEVTGSRIRVESHFLAGYRGALYLFPDIYFFTRSNKHLSHSWPISQLLLLLDFVMPLFGMLSYVFLVSFYVHITSIFFY